MRAGVATADEATVAWFDRLAVFWVVLWLAVGIGSAVTVWQAAEVGDTISSSGAALQTAGKAISGFSSVPVIGDDAEKLGGQVTTTSADVAARGEEVRSQFRRLAVLLGFLVTLLPILPALGVYLPLRSARRRELREIRAALGDQDRAAQVDRLLARRAVQNLSFSQLLALERDPDAGSAGTRELADAELRRLGLARP